MKRLAVIFISVSILLLSSCGFHLRGVGNSVALVPEQLRAVYLKSASPFASFEQVLRQNLRGYGIEIVDQEEKHDLILHIISYNINQTMGSVATNLQTRQYILTYTVNYELLAADGTAIIPPTSVMSMTTFTASLSAMLMTTNNISEQYITSLRNDAAFRLINRLLAENTKAELDAYNKKMALNKVAKKATKKPMIDE